MARFAIFACWILVLLIEILFLYNTIHVVHGPEDTLFNIVLITITLVVGAVGTTVTRNSWTKS
ncbi:hypothetical protein SAMN05428962_2714 [Paenibacillus sp. BC26]|nr:hypothetical protein SAMN05428962_2714 [Paenibacillus sp. BC26]